MYIHLQPSNQMQGPDDAMTLNSYTLSKPCLLSELPTRVKRKQWHSFLASETVLALTTPNAAGLRSCSWCPDISMSIPSTGTSTGWRYWSILGVLRQQQLRQQQVACQAATMTANTSPCCASWPASARTAATLPATGAVTATSICTHGEGW